jgi:catechol 2,3-dioxygenase-like lactoylglutathione lyase family enzyme
MKLNHIDLQVADVQETARFFETYFDFKLLTSASSNALAVLQGRDGFSLVLQKLKNPQAAYPEGFHIGFVLEDVEQVYKMFERLKLSGITLGEVNKNNRGTMFYFNLPGGILTEVSSKKI